MKFGNGSLVILAAALIATSCGADDSGAGPARAAALSGPMTVMTFNVLCSFCDVENYDPWAERLDYFADIITRHDPDLIGLQEPFEAADIDDILAGHPEYQAIYFKNDDFLKDYPDATILYRAERFEVAESGFYWLSPTPDEPWSTGFADGFQLPRLVAWARLRETATGAEFFFADTHFDNNTPSQQLSAPLFLERTEPWAAELPVVVVGDFNSQPDDPAYHILVEGTEESDFHFVNAFDVAEQWSVETNQEPAPEYDEQGRIDHIFLAGADWRVSWWKADLYVYGDLDRYPSDHRAMAAEIVLE